MSSSTDLPSGTGLSRFAVDGDAPTREKWRPAPLGEATSLRVLAFDQTLASAGWVCLHGWTCFGSGVIAAEPSTLKGPPLSVDRGARLHRWVEQLIKAMEPTHIVCEMPPIQGGGMRRPESSLMASLAIAIAADTQALPFSLVSGQTAKKRFGGNSSADKKAVREGIFEVAPWFRVVKPMNEHVADALALALVFQEQHRGE